MIKKSVTLLGAALAFSLVLFLVCCLRIEAGDGYALNLTDREEASLPTVLVTVDTSLVCGAKEAASAAAHTAEALPSAFTEPISAVLSRMGELLLRLTDILYGERRPHDAAFVFSPSAYSASPSHTMYGHG